MGAEPYEYFVPYERNIQAALDKLRAEVFQSGAVQRRRYGPRYSRGMLEMADADGTASILDIQRIADHPDYFCAAPLSSKELRQLFGTDKPTRDDVQQSDEFWDSLDRGQARYVVLYEDEQPTELYFAGYSFD